MEKGYIFIHNNIFPSLFALSSKEQQQGLMYVEPPAPIMTFIYTNPQINKFWMSNTKAPLDILFCQAGKISEICHGEPFSTEIIGSNLLSDLVIELPSGTAITNKMKIGQTIGIVQPSTEHLYKIIASHPYY